MTSATITIDIGEYERLRDSQRVLGTLFENLPVMISGFITERAVYWDRVAAAGMLVLLPTAILGVAVQRYLATGLAAGAVKG